MNGRPTEEWNGSFKPEITVEMVMKERKELCVYFKKKKELQRNGIEAERRRR